MSEERANKPKSSRPFKIVGRDSRIDLSRYTATVHGREVIDYEKLKLENPKLYEEILKDEKECDLLNNTELLC